MAWVRPTVARGNAHVSAWLLGFGLVGPDHKCDDSGSRALALEPEEGGVAGWLMFDESGAFLPAAGARLLVLFAAAGRDPQSAALLRQSLQGRMPVLPDSLLSLPHCGSGVVQAAWLSLLTQDQRADWSRFEPLLTRIGELKPPTRISWPLLKEDARADRQGNGMSFLIKGSASACIDFISTSQVEGLSGLDGEALVLLSFKGDVAAEAGARVPVNLGLASVSVSGRGGTTLEYVTHHGRETLFAEAALTSLDRLGSPFSLPSVASFLQAFPHGAINLAGHGDLRLATSFALAAMPGPGIPGTGTVKIDASASWSGAYTTCLSLADPGDPSHVQVEVKRSEGAQSALGVAAKLDIDTSALSRQLKGVLSDVRAGNRDVSALVTRLDPFFQPGTMLKSRLAGMVKDWTADPALKSVLQSIAGLGAAGDPGEVVETHLESQLNRIGNLWERTAGSVASDVLSSLQTSGGHTVLATNVAVRLSASLEILLNALHDELETEVRRVVSGNPAYQEMIETLNALDFGLGGHFQALDERAREVVGPVKKLLAGFQSSVSDLAGKVETYLTSRLAVQFGFGGARENSSGLVLKAVFDARSEKAASLFCRLFARDLAESFMAMQSAPQDVEVIEGQFTRVLSRSSYSVGSLNFADVALDSKAILKAQAAFAIDQTGAITAIVEGAIEKEQRGLGEAECVSFGNRVELQAQRENARASVTLKIVKTDKSLRREELKAFVSPLAAAGILGATAEPVALANWEMWKPVGAKGLACRLRLECKLGSDEILELLQLTRSASGVVVAPAALDQDRVRTAAAEAVVTEVFAQGAGSILRRKVEMLLLRLSKQAQGVPGELVAGIAWASSLPRGIEREINPHVWGSLPGEATGGAGALQWAGELVKGLCLALENMRRLVLLKPVVSGEAGPGEITPEQALACEHDMLRTLAPWVQTEGLSFRDLLGSSDRSDIAEVTLALLRTVQALASKGRKLHDVRATMEKLDPDGRPLPQPVLVMLS